MSEPFVTVYRGSDPILVDLLAELLRDGGVPARVSGTRHGALVGVGQHILDLSIHVPASSAGQAADFIEDYMAGAPEDVPDDEDDALPSPRPGLRQSRLFAAGSALLLFGGAHFYAGRAMVALSLAVVQLWAIHSMVGARSWPTLMAAVCTTVAILAVDVLGGQFAVTQNLRGRVLPHWRQLLAGLGLAAVAVLAGQLLGPRIPRPENAMGEERPWESVAPPASPLPTW